MDALPVPGVTYDTTLTTTDYELNCYGYPTTPPPGPDTVAPTVTITSPVNDSGARSVTTATGTASDAVGVTWSACRLYRYTNPVTGVPAGYWAGGNTWTADAVAANELPVTGTTNWSFALPVLVPGRYAVRPLAGDAAGNTGIGTAAAFFVDPNPPSVVTITTPLNGSTVSSVTMAGTASDASDGIGVTGVRGQLRRNSDGLYWNGASWAAPAFSFPVTLNGINWWRSANFPYGVNLVAGSYTVTATATDKAGNSKAVTSTFNVAPSGGDAGPSTKLS